MEAGKRRHRITLQRPTGDLDSNGDSIFESIVPDVRASIETLSVREQFVAAQQHGSATHRVTFNWRSDLDAIEASWRLQFHTGRRDSNDDEILRLFILVGPPSNIDQRNRDIQLLCEEGLKTE